jgi:hypothetical protein
MAIDFTRYRAPGVYTESLGGPQLAVSSSYPTAVAIFGTSVGYRTFRESIKIDADSANATGTIVPTLSKTLAKAGIQAITTAPKVIATVNVSLASPGATIQSVALVANDLVYLSAQTDETQNGLYKWKRAAVSGALVALEPVVDTFKVVNPSTGFVYINGRDYTIVKVSPGDTSQLTVRDDTYAIKRVDRNPQSLARVVATTNINLASPGATIATVALNFNDLVYLSAQTDAGQNGLYQWKAAATSGTDLAMVPYVDPFGIQPGDVVQVSYRYTNAKQFEVWSLYDYDDVRDLYGEPFSPDGTIQSEISLAAKIAFLNGASVVLTCAVDPDANANIEESYQDALNLFRDEDQIAIIVPANGDQYLHELVRQHVSSQSENKYERRAVLGIDGSSGSVDTGTRTGYAELVRDERIAMVSPSRFTHYAPELGREVVLGGQYMAAAVAGRSVSQIAAMPLTRKAIYGFSGVDENPPQREGEKDLETQNGLLVIEKTRRNQIQVRHGVTTNPTDLLTREWSIIGQRDVMVYRIRDFLDADGLIGMPIYDTTLIQVKASAEAALVSLVRDQIIVGYQNLKVRQIGTLPDVIEVRYEWKPAYPLNYIVVRYSVAVMTGDVTIAGA